MTPANDDANGATTTLTITVADLNDQAPVYQAADADDAISVAEGFGTGTLDAGTITDTDTVGTLGCTLGGADAADFTCSISGNNYCIRWITQIMKTLQMPMEIISMWLLYW